MAEDSEICALSVSLKHLKMLKRLKDRFNQGQDRPKYNDENKEEEDKMENKTRKDDRRKEDRGHMQGVGVAVALAGPVNILAGPLHIPAGATQIEMLRKLRDNPPSEELLMANRVKYLNMDLQEKRQLYRCGENFLIKEQIPSWAASIQQRQDIDASIKPDKLASQQEYQPDMTLNQKVAVWFGDITRLEIDAVVNSTNSTLLLEKVGVNKAIRDAAGQELDLELGAKYKIEDYSVFKTVGFKLPAKWIYHISGPGDLWSLRSLSACYTNALNEMKKDNCRTIAFPCISAGHKRIPMRKSADVALVAVRKWLAANFSSVDKVIFCVIDKKAWDVYIKTMHVVYPPTEAVPDALQGSKLPVEILRMDSKSVELYKKALEDGKEKDYNIRLMIVGGYGVGKTTLTKRLLCQSVNVNERKSTDGIDVYVGRCRVSLKTMDWIVDPAQTTVESAINRLAKILGSTGITDTDEVVSQIFEENDRYGANANKEIMADENVEEDETTKENQNSSPTANTAMPLIDFDFVDGVVCSHGDTISSADKQEDILTNSLKEVVDSAEIPEDDENATVSIWDFGGQFVFYTTHQMFLSHRAIYILVNNFSQHIGDLVMDDEPYFDCSGTKRLRIEELIDIWLNSIHGHSKYDRPGAPPVVLVGTHTDKLEPEQREAHVEAMFDGIRNRFAGKDASFHFIDKDFGLSNAIEDPKLNDLRQTILKVAKQQHYWGELKPARWIPLEKMLEDVRKRNVEIINRSAIEELSSTLPVPISSDDELDLFLRFQHEIANIMYFSIPELRDKIVLTPQFLVNALKSLITAEMFCKKKPEILETWREFQQMGILKSNLLDAVWKKGENTRFEVNRDHILALMEHLNIIARPIPNTENEDACDCDTIQEQEQDYFLVPCMLTQPPPDSIFQSEGSFISTPCLCLMLNNIAFPSAIFNRLLVACMSKWPVAKRGQKYLMYCGCGQFDVDVQHRLTLLFTSNVIGLRIVRYCETDRHPSGTVCKDVYSVVKQTLQRIGDGLSLVLDYKEFLKCPLGREESFECLHAVDNVRDCNEFPCHGHDHVQILHSGDLLKYWFDSEVSDQTLDTVDHLEPPLSLPTHFMYRVPSDKELAKISKGIGKEFHQLSLELGVSQTRIDQIRGSYPLNVTDQIIQLLIEWRKQTGRKATFRELEKAMLSVGVDTVAAFRDIRL